MCMFSFCLYAACVDYSCYVTKTQAALANVLAVHMYIKMKHF